MVVLPRFLDAAMTPASAKGKGEQGETTVGKLTRRQKHAARGVVQTQEEQRQVRGTAVRKSLENELALPVYCAV